jgi:PEGA domain
MGISCGSVDVVAVGTISISSTPVGANVYLAPSNGVVPGTYVYKGVVTSITNVPIGNYFIKLTLTNYADYETSSFAVTTNTNTPITATFLGSLSISSVLTGASVYIDAVYKGVTPLIVTGLSAGTHNYQLTKTGYASTAVTNFDITAGTTTTVTGVSFLGSAAFTSSPTGADIWIDGSDTGVNTNGTAIGLTAGPHSYTLKMTNYADVTGNLPTSAANDTTVTVSLVTMSPTGSIHVLSNPAGASVHLDGSGNSSLGVTPMTITQVLTGTHTVTLKLNTYQDYTETGISVTQGATAEVSHTMVLSTGSASFVSTPAGSRIWIGTPLVDQGAINATPYIVTSLVPGTYNYELRLTDYATLSGTVDVSAGQQTNKVLTFAGSAYITSSPTGAEIFLAQSPYNPADQSVTTPRTMTGMTAATSGATTTWNYKLTKALYTDKTGSFLATAGQTISVPITMLTVAHIQASSITVTPSESPCVQGTCHIDVSVTWVNTGQSAGLSDLSITVSGGTSTITPASYPSVAFEANGTNGDTATKTFIVSGIDAEHSPHEICPNPNT